jgi:hypothetical protein
MCRGILLRQHCVSGSRDLGGTHRMLGDCVLGTSLRVCLKKKVRQVFVASLHRRSKHGWGSPEAGVFASVPHWAQ